MCDVIQSLTEALIQEVHKLKQENISKGKRERNKSREELKKKNKEHKGILKHNK